MPRPKGLAKTGGRTAGTLNKATVQANIDKELQREALRRLVCAKLEPMTQAQIAHAQGISYVVLRREDGTYARATDEQELDAALAAGAEHFRVFTAAPNTQAFTDLMNRALDKPAEQLLVSGPAGGPLEIVVRKPW